MSSVVISEEDYKRSLLDSDIGGFASAVREQVFNLLSEYRDQKVTYEVTFKTYLSHDILDEFSNYGFYLDPDNIVRVEKDRNYIVFVDPSVTEETIAEFCSKFASMYLPAGAVPREFVVLKSLETYEEFVYWNDLMRTIYPEIVPMNSYPKLKMQAQKALSFETLINEVRELGKEPLIIDTELEALHESYLRGNRGTMHFFRLLEESARAQAKPNSILVSNDQQGSIPVIAAYLFYMYGITPHFNYANTELYLDKLSSLLFDRNHMLLEDQFKYLRSLPDLMVKMSETLEFNVYLYKDAMQCAVSMFCMPVQEYEDSDLERFVMDLREITVIDLIKEFNYETTDTDSLKKNHDTLNRLFATLEAKIGRNGKSVNVTNTAFIEINGTKYLAYVDDIDLKLPAHIIPVNPDYPFVSTTLGLRDIRSLYPVNAFPGFETNLRLLKVALPEISKGQAQLKDVRFYKTKYALGVIVNHFNTMGQSLLDPNTVPQFLTLGLWWHETSKYRSFLYEDLSKHIDFVKYRKKSNVISIFGGPHPLLPEAYSLTEEFLKG